MRFSLHVSDSISIGTLFVWSDSSDRYVVPTRSSPALSILLSSSGNNKSSATDYFESRHALRSQSATHAYTRSIATKSGQALRVVPWSRGLYPWPWGLCHWPWGCILDLEGCVINPCSYSFHYHLARSSASQYLNPKRHLPNRHHLRGELQPVQDQEVVELPPIPAITAHRPPTPCSRDLSKVGTTTWNCT